MNINCVFVCVCVCVCVCVIGGGAWGGGGLCIFAYFYAPNFEEVEGAYWFGSVRGDVRASVTLAYGQERLEIGGQFHKTAKQELRLKFFLKWKVYSYSVSQNLKLKSKIFHETGSGSWNLICGITMKYKRTHVFLFFFFSIGLVVAELCPFFDIPIVSLWNLVNKIAWTPLELGS